MSLVVRSYQRHDGEIQLLTAQFNTVRKQAFTHEAHLFFFGTDEGTVGLSFRASGSLRRRTPGSPSSRKAMPARSMQSTTFRSVSNRAPMTPSKDSILRTVPMATLDLRASSICSHPSNARAARNCLPVMTFKRRR